MIGFLAIVGATCLLGSAGIVCVALFLASRPDEDRHP